MPFNTLHEITNSYWFFGKLWCDLWHSLDVFASTASINSLVIIALDRHSAISDPINYHTRWLTRHWLIFVTGIWICSAIISFPAIAYWRSIAPNLNITNNFNSPYKDNVCTFTDDIYYLVFSSLVSFYVPLSVMIFVYIRIYRAATRQMTALKTGQKVNVKSSDGTQLTLRIHRGGYHRVDGTSAGGTSSPNTSGGVSSKSTNKDLKNTDNRVNTNKTITNKINDTNKTNYLLSPTNQKSILIRTTSEEFLNTTTNGSSLSPSPTDDLRRFSFGNANINKYASECCLYSQTFLSAGTISSSQSSVKRPSIGTIQDFQPPPTVAVASISDTKTIVASTASPKPAKQSRIKFKLNTSSKKSTASRDSTKKADPPSNTATSNNSNTSNTGSKIKKKKSPMSLRRLVLTSKNRLNSKRAKEPTANTTAPTVTPTPNEPKIQSKPSSKGRVMSNFKRLSSRFKLRRTIRFKEKLNSIDASNNIATMTIPEIVYTESDDTIFQENLVYLRNNNNNPNNNPSNISNNNNTLSSLSKPTNDNITESVNTKTDNQNSNNSNNSNNANTGTDEIVTITTLPATSVAKCDDIKIITPSSTTTVTNAVASTTKPHKTNVDAILTVKSDIESDNLDNEVDDVNDGDNDDEEDDDDVDYVNSFAAKQQEKQQQQQELLSSKYKTTNFSKCLTSDNINDLKFSLLNQNDILAVSSQQQHRLMKQNSQIRNYHQQQQQLQLQRFQSQPQQLSPQTKAQHQTLAATAAVLASMPLNIKRVQKQIQLNPHALQFYHQHYYQHHLELQQAQALRHYSKRIQQRQKRQQQQQQQKQLAHQQIARPRNDSTASAYSSSSSSNRYSKAKLISKKMKSFNITKKFCKFSREQKAAKTLGIVMGVFIICWLPFFIYNVITGIFKAKLPKSHELIYAIFTWLGYINSGCNPIIYAFSSRDFRRAFYKILCPSSFMRANQRLATRDCVSVSATEHTTLRLNSRRNAILNCHICQIYEHAIQSNSGLYSANIQQLLRSSSTFSLNRLSSGNVINSAPSSTGGTNSTTALLGTNALAATTALTALTTTTTALIQPLETTPLTSSLTHNRPNNLRADKALNGLLKLNKITFEPSISNSASFSKSNLNNAPTTMIERIRQRVLLAFSLTKNANKKNCKQRKKRQLKSRSISTCDSLISRSSNSSSYNATTIYKRKCRNSKKRDSNFQLKNPLFKVYN